MSERAASRQAAFKNQGRDTKDLRRKRAETSVALRRAARDEQLLKRRACSPEGDDVQVDTGVLPSPNEIVEGLKGDDLAELVASARAARRTLSREQNPPISIMVSAGVIAPLVRALDRDDCTDLQFEAAWALTNIASGTHDHTLAVIDGGAVPKLVGLLARGGAVGEQCAWAVGNIAGDGAYARDIVLDNGALSALLPLLSMEKRPASQTRTAVWTLSNLCRNKNPMVVFEKVAPCLPYLAGLLTMTDNDVLSDACWALSYMTDGPNERIEAVQLTPGLLERLVACLSHPAAAVQTPALRAVGNMVTGSDVQTDRCLEAGCLAALSQLLQSPKSALIKEAAWAVSNIVAGSQDQIQCVVESDILQRVARVLDTGDARCQKEAAWVITNFCLGGSGPQLCALLATGFLRPFCALLSAPDPRMIIVVLEGISHLLQAGERFGEVEQLCLKLEEEGALDKLEQLQTHENEQIYKKTLALLDQYFADGTEADQNQPAQTNEEFQFGADPHEYIGQF